jgi:hypothetical protein
VKLVPSSLHRVAFSDWCVGEGTFYFIQMRREFSIAEFSDYKNMRKTKKTETI